MCRDPLARRCRHDFSASGANEWKVKPPPLANASCSTDELAIAGDMGTDRDDPRTLSTPLTVYSVSTGEALLPRVPAAADASAARPVDTAGPRRPVRRVPPVDAVAGPDPHHRGPAAGLHRAPDPRRPGRHHRPRAAQHRRPDRAARISPHPLTGAQLTPQHGIQLSQPTKRSSAEEVAMMTTRGGRPTGPKDAP